MSPYCPWCGNQASMIDQHKQWYCPNCKRYIELPPSTLPPSAEIPAVSMDTEVLQQCIEDILDAKTVLHKKTKKVVWLQDEVPQVVGDCKMEGGWGMTEYKGTFYYTQYRLVFFEKGETLFSTPTRKTFWLKPKVGGQEFMMNVGIIRKEFKPFNTLEFDYTDGYEYFMLNLKAVYKKEGKVVDTYPVDLKYRLMEPQWASTMKLLISKAEPINVARIAEHLALPKGDRWEYCYTS